MSFRAETRKEVLGMVKRGVNIIDHDPCNENQITELGTHYLEAWLLKYGSGVAFVWNNGCVYNVTVAFPAEPEKMPKTIEESIPIFDLYPSFNCSGGVA